MKAISIDDTIYTVVKEFSLHQPDLVDNVGWIAKSPKGENVFIKTIGGNTYFIATKKELTKMYERHAVAAAELVSAIVEL